MQQTTRKAVRYYIDRDADTPVIRSVPVARAIAPADPAPVPTLAPEPERHAPRARLSRLVPRPVRRRRSAS